MKIRKYLCAVFYLKKIKKEKGLWNSKQTSNQSGKSYIEKCIYGRNNNLRPNHGRPTEQGRLTRQQWTLSKRTFSMKYRQNRTERLYRDAQLWRLSSSTPTVCLCVLPSKPSSHHLTAIDQTARVLRKFLEVARCLPHFYCPFSVFVLAICSYFQAPMLSLANERGKYLFYVLHIDFVVICYYT